ncbi:MAG: cupin domain-containing protein [Proteobacteria bacterium]|nr:cupin domain-containing protein [Pseudomonadota bacterium]
MIKESYLAKPLDLKNLVEYQEDSVISKEILKKATGTLTVFAFDKGQGLSEHTAPFDAIVIILDGCANIYINKELKVVKTGEMIIMPANIPHSLSASQRFKMLLVMIKG